MEFDASIVEGDEGVVVLTGELDAAAALAVGSVFDQATATATDVVVDMSGVTFMDSTGLRSLLQLHQRLSAMGGTVSVRNARPNVARVFELSGLTEMMRLGPDASAETAETEPEDVTAAGGTQVGPDEVEGPNSL